MSVVSDVVKMELYDRPEDAPNYNNNGEDRKTALLTNAVVVGRGTHTGKPTVDLCFEDDKGNKFVAMCTASMLANIVAGAEGIYQRTQAQDKAN